MKSISLGDGQRIEIDYDGLKKKLKVNNVNSGTADDLLRKYFPAEHRLEIKNGGDAFKKRRWDAWFSEGNKSLQRKLIVQTPEELAWQGDGVPRTYNNNRANILAMAQRVMMREYQGLHRNSVTDFSGWIFRLEHASSVAGMSDGKVGEQLVQKAKKNRFVAPCSFDSDWDQIYFDNFAEPQQGQKISLLTIGGNPLYGKPDYVFFNKKSETALIVEIKTSDAYLPPDSWPNVRAQLWAYGHLDFVIEKAKHIILIGEVWTRIDERTVGRRRTYRWEMSDAEFCRENEELFDCYQQHASR